MRDLSNRRFQNAGQQVQYEMQTLVTHEPFITASF